jgi:dGTP triphosphohydrolase
MGLNLTKQTIDGILNHSQGSNNISNNHITNESKVVMYSDKIAYVFADINDLQRINILSSSDLNEINSIFPIDSTYGNNQRTRVTTCINALVKESADKGYISFEDSEIAQNFKKLKKHMYGYYDNLDSNLLKEVVRSVITEVSNINGHDPVLVTALMTDSEIKTLYQKIISSRRINLNDLTNFGVGEIIKDGFLEGQTYQDLNTRLNQKLFQLC